MTITMKQYMADKVAFYHKHSGENGYKEQSSCEGATIRKTVNFEDGATWYEVTEPVFEMVEVEVKGLMVKVKVKLYHTEVWDTENALSRHMYERAVA